MAIIQSPRPLGVISHVWFRSNGVGLTACMSESRTRSAPGLRRLLSGRLARALLSSLWLGRLLIDPREGPVCLMCDGVRAVVSSRPHAFPSRRPHCALSIPRRLALLLHGAVACELLRGLSAWLFIFTQHGPSLT